MRLVGGVSTTQIDSSIHHRGSLLCVRAAAAAVGRAHTTFLHLQAGAPQPAEGSGDHQGQHTYLRGSSSSSTASAQRQRAVSCSTHTVSGMGQDCRQAGTQAGTPLPAGVHPTHQLLGGAVH